MHDQFEIYFADDALHSPGWHFDFNEEHVGGPFTTRTEAYTSLSRYCDMLARIEDNKSV